MAKIQKNEQNLQGKPYLKPHGKTFLYLVMVILTSILCINLVSASLADSVIHYYKLDETSGSIAEDIAGLEQGTQYNGTLLTNAEFDVNGKINGGAVNGTNGLLNITDIKGDTPELNYTISFWANLINVGANLNVFASALSGDFQTYFIAGGNLIRFYVGGSFVDTGAGSFNASKWNHVVVTGNDTGHYVYINGVLEANIVGTISDMDLHFGSEYDYRIADVFRGTMDEIGIWNISLNQTEITTLYDGGVGLPYDYFAFGTEVLSVNLISPSLNSIQSNLSLTFNASLNPISANITNATINVWYTNGTLFNQTTNIITGNELNYSIWNISNFTLGNYEWNVLGCYENSITGGHINCTYAESNYTFFIGASLNFSTYNYNTFETSIETFNASFNILEDSEISLVQLSYNGINYTISDITQTDTSLVVSRTINLPLNPNKFENITNEFYYTFTYGGDFTQTSQVFEQNISFINLQRCNSTWDILALNFTLYDEVNLTKINPVINPVSFASTFRYWLGDGSVYKNYSYQIINSSLASANNFTFCIYPYQPSNYTFKTDLDGVFSAQGYSENEYYLRNATLTNDTAPFSLFLYILGSADSTKFYVTVKQGITFIDNALVNIAKYFVGSGDYRTTSIKITDNDGEFPVFLDIDNKYLFSIIKDGQVLGIVEKTASCATAPCLLEINLDESIPGVFDYYNTIYASNVVSNLTFDSTTKMVNYIFVDTSGLANYFRLVVKQMSYNGSLGTTICDKFSYSSAGILSCNVTGYNGEFYATGFVSRSPETIDKVLGFFISDALETLGLLGIFLNLAIIITVVLATAGTTRGNPSAIIFMLGITILLLKIGGLFPFSWAVVVPLELVILWALMKTKT